MVPTPPPSPGVPHFKPLGKVKLLVRLGGLRMHNNPNNNSRQKDLTAAGQLAPVWQTMRNAVQKQMMAAALGQKSRAAKDNFNVRRRPMLKRTSRSLPCTCGLRVPVTCVLCILRRRAACIHAPLARVPPRVYPRPSTRAVVRVPASGVPHVLRTVWCTTGKSSHYVR